MLVNGLIQTIIYVLIGSTLIGFTVVLVNRTIKTTKKIEDSMTCIICSYERSSKYLNNFDDMYINLCEECKIKHEINNKYDLEYYLYKVKANKIIDNKKKKEEEERQKEELEIKKKVIDEHYNLDRKEVEDTYKEESKEKYDKSIADYWKNEACMTFHKRFKYDKYNNALIEVGTLDNRVTANEACKALYQINNNRTHTFNANMNYVEDTIEYANLNDNIDNSYINKNEMYIEDCFDENGQLVRYEKSLDINGNTVTTKRLVNDDRIIEEKTEDQIKELIDKVMPKLLEK